MRLHYIRSYYLQHVCFSAGCCRWMFAGSPVMDKIAAAMIEK